MVERATVLKCFEKVLGLNEGGKYEKEDELHSLFFPMRMTSDDVDFAHHNLWLLDERLSFHLYLASDKAFKSQGAAPVAVDDGRRADLLIYNRPHSFSSQSAPIGSVIIVEFKRPERAGYSSNAMGAEDQDKNPIDQVLDYVQVIRDGKARQPNGSSVEGVLETTPFYCYIVATLTDSLRREARKRGFLQMPDGLGYFLYNQPMKTYIEILSYKKVLADAEQRNRAFFEKLQLRVR